MQCRNLFLTGLPGLILFAISVIASANNPPEVNVGYCPAPQELMLNNLFWGTPNGWASFTESFDKKIVQFEKAQWQGVNVGKILCIYKGDSSLEFPIVLEQQNHQVIAEPNFANWTGNQGGYKDCTSTAVKDCPFEISQKAQVTDPYQELDFFKNRATP